ncbi:MAG: hypothetical protein NT011_03715 [Kiritimatiellaeota bacterium]|nr:hypothetical protein [Kiritimatiellota bacterium]
MHIKPLANRFKAMCLGYCISLPFVYMAYQWMPGLTTIPLHEPWGIGLFFAYFLHLLFFLLYVECFYHVERSVTLRFLVEILQQSPPGARLDQILDNYNVESMIHTRLAALEKNNFIECKDARWRLKPKGGRLAKLMRISAWIYQSAGQADRL